MHMSSGVQSTAERRIGRWGAGHARIGDVFVADVPIMNRPLEDAENAIERMLPDAQCHARGGVVRDRVPADIGEGYWDFVRASPHITVSIAEVLYNQNYRVRVWGGRLFKLRLLIEGRLVDDVGQTLIAAPKAQLHVSCGSDDGYIIPAGTPTRMVVVHCHADVLADRLGLTLNKLPDPLSALFTGGMGDKSTQAVGLGPGFLTIAQRIVDSRVSIPTEIRAACIDALATDLICQLIAELTDRALMQRATLALTAREIAAVYEARDLLLHGYADPPGIVALARRVGLNQTKLKAAFKEVVGTTIYGYVLERRMERACELLVAGNHSVSEIAYSVGYEFPANFSNAFRKHTGESPNVWRRPK